MPLTARATYDYTVRAKVTGLAPNTPYYYRFVAGDETSATGAARTAPEANEANDRVRFAWLNCQDWGVNHWQAMSLIAAESDLAFVVHVGDYIYDSVAFNKVKPLNPDGSAPADALLDRTRQTVPRGAVEGQVEHLQR